MWCTRGVAGVHIASSVRGPRGILGALGEVTLGRTLGAALTLGATLSWCSVAGAQVEAPPSDAALGARDLFDRGTAAYAVGNYEQAIRDWQTAYATDPRPRIMYNVSQAYERLGRLEEAIAALETFITTAQPDDSRYSDANARLAALRQRLALTGVMIHTSIEGGRILIDGADWGRTPRPDKIQVTPGPHQVVISWPDGRDYNTNVVVPPGQVIEIEVSESGLRHSALPIERSAEPSSPALASEPPSTPAPPPEPSEPSSSIVPWIIAGAAGAVGVATIAWGINRQAELGGCGDEGFTCLHEGAVSTQRTLGFVLGGVFLAGGATALVFALKGGPREDTALVRCGVGVGSASCRLSF